MLGVKSGRCQGVVSRLLEDIEVHTAISSSSSHQVHHIANDEEDEAKDGGYDSAAVTRETSLLRGGGGPPGALLTTASHSSQSLSANGPQYCSDGSRNNLLTSTSAAPNPTGTGLSSCGSSLGGSSLPRQRHTPFDAKAEGSTEEYVNVPPSQPPSKPTPPQVSIDQFCLLLSNILQTRLKGPFYPRGCILSPTTTTATSTTTTPARFNEKEGRNGGKGARQGSWQEDEDGNENDHNNNHHRQQEEDPLTRHIRVMGKTLLWGCTPVVVLLAGTSGSGKSTLGSLLAQRLGIHTLIATDAIREQLRHQIRHCEAACTQQHQHEQHHQPPLSSAVAPTNNNSMRPLFFSTYEAHQGLYTATPTAHELPAFTAAPTHLQQLTDAECVGSGGGGTTSPKIAQYNASQTTSVGLTNSISGGGFSSGSTPKGAVVAARGAFVPVAHDQVSEDTAEQHHLVPPSIVTHHQHSTIGCSTPTSSSSSSVTISGYLAQCRPVQEVLTKSILRLVQSGESVVVEGVHLTPQYMMDLADKLNFSSPSSLQSTTSDTLAPPTSTTLPSLPPTTVVCPFLIQIDKSDKHKERFAVRVKSMSLLPNRNNYVKNFKSIREIQDYLLSEVTGPIQRFRANYKNGIPKHDYDDEKIMKLQQDDDGDDRHSAAPYFPICKVRNTNADRSLMRVHGAVVSVISAVRHYSVKKEASSHALKQQVLMALTETITTSSSSTSNNLNSPQTRALSSKVAHFQHTTNDVDTALLGSDELLEHPPVHRKTASAGESERNFQNMGSGDLNTAMYDDVEEDFEEGGGVGSVETNLLSSVQGGYRGVDDSHNSMDSEGYNKPTTSSSHTHPNNLTPRSTPRHARKYASFLAETVVPRTSSTRLELLSSKEAVSIIFAKNRSKNRRGNRRMRRIESCGGGSGDGVNLCVEGHLLQQYGQLVTPKTHFSTRKPKLCPG